MPSSHQTDGLPVLLLSPPDRPGSQRAAIQARHLRHPGLLLPHATFVAQQSHELWSVLPLQSQGDLEGILRVEREGGLDEASVAYVAHELLQTLAHVHEQGFVHR